MRAIDAEHTAWCEVQKHKRYSAATKSNYKGYTLRFINFVIQKGGDPSDFDNNNNYCGNLSPYINLFITKIIRKNSTTNCWYQVVGALKKYYQVNYMDHKCRFDEEPQFLQLKDACQNLFGTKPHKKLPYTMEDIRKYTTLCKCNIYTAHAMPFNNLVKVCVFQAANFTAARGGALFPYKTKEGSKGITLSQLDLQQATTPHPASSHFRIDIRIKNEKTTLKHYISVILMMISLTHMHIYLFYVNVFTNKSIMIQPYQYIKG